ncbi:MAG: DUF1993 family protein [Elainellaceae cyanobacterium]
MTISMHQASVPLITRALTSLIETLKKGEAYAQAKGIDPAVLVNSRLYPDMFPLARQVQIASDVANRGMARLADLEVPSMEDTETTFPELVNRLQKTIDYLEGLSADQIDGTEEKDITVPIGGDKTMTLQGWPFLSYFVLPNLYFHVTTAYDILRHNGVEVGKRDFLGRP